jgi:hypothetical protein
MVVWNYEVSSTFTAMSSWTLLSDHINDCIQWTKISQCGFSVLRIFISYSTSLNPSLHQVENKEYIFSHIYMIHNTCSHFYKTTHNSCCYRSPHSYHNYWMVLFTLFKHTQHVIRVVQYGLTQLHYMNTYENTVICFGFWRPFSTRLDSKEWKYVVVSKIFRIDTVKII